jgi:hypothetical protein
MTTEAGVAVAPGAAGWVRLGILVLAALRLWGALSNLAVFANLSEYDNSLAQWMIFANTALAPFLAGAAVYYAARHRLANAIVALAGMAIAELLLVNVPSLLNHGPDNFGSGPYAVFVFVRAMVLPALCFVAVWLARQNRQLTLAAVLASLPVIADIIGVVTFAIGVMIYGF